MTFTPTRAETDPIDDTIFDPSTHVYVPIAALKHVLEAARAHTRFASSVLDLEDAIYHGDPPDDLSRQQRELSEDYRRILNR